MRIKRDQNAISDFFHGTVPILWLETNITEQHVTEGLKEVEGGRIKIAKRGEMWLRGISQVFRGPAHRLFPPPDSTSPTGLGCRQRWGPGQHRSLFPARTGAPLTPAALHRPAAQTCRSLLSRSFICGAVSLLAVSELLHSDTMSEISVNEHLEGILSDFEGMWTVIFTGFTAAPPPQPLLSPVKPQWDRVRRGFDLWRPDNPIFALCNLSELHIYQIGAGGLPFVQKHFSTLMAGHRSSSSIIINFICDQLWMTCKQPLH